MVHRTNKLSPFEVVYSFNPITPLDLIPFPSSFDFVHKEEVSKSKFVKNLHEKVRNQIQTQNDKYAKYNKKGKKARIFNEGDIVWLHLRKEKERFPYLQKSKLNPWGDGPFQIHKKINDNTYKLDLPSKYDVHSTFNVTDLIPFIGIVDDDDDDEHQDLRPNPFQRGGDDEIGPSPFQGPIPN